MKCFVFYNYLRVKNFYLTETELCLKCFIAVAFVSANWLASLLKISIWTLAQS